MATDGVDEIDLSGTTVIDYSSIADSALCSYSAPAT